MFRRTITISQRFQKRFKNSDLFSEDQQKLLKEVALENGFSKPIIEATGKTSKGDNFLAKIYFVEVKENDNSKKLSLVLKSGHTNDNLRKFLALEALYKREIYIYGTILPAFFEFQKKHNITNPFYGIPKVYKVLGTEKEETLILENIKERGYCLWDRKIPMNSEHIAAVLKEYAKFHSISFAFKYYHPQKFEELTKCLTDFYDNPKTYQDENYVTFRKRTFKTAYEALGDHPAKKALERCESQETNFFIHTLKEEQKYFAVIHGDSWCNNFMFKYKDTGDCAKPEKVCILDWQKSKLASSVLDISSFFYINAGKENLENTHKFLSIYHEALSENLRDYGCDPEKVYSLEVFQSHWKKLSKYGLYNSLHMFEVLLRDANDSYDLSELAGEETDDISKSFETYEVYNLKADVEEKRNTRIYDLVTIMAEKEYI